MFKVRKREGKIVSFEIKKITEAITKAFEAENKVYDENIIDFLALKVTANFESKIKDNIVDVEDIQDSVESVLISAGYGDVAKAYILYRKLHDKMRNIKRQAKYTVSKALLSIFNVLKGIYYERK